MSRWERQSHINGVEIAEVRKSEGGGLLESPKPKLLRNWNSPKTVLSAFLWRHLVAIVSTACRPGTVPIGISNSQISRSLDRKRGLEY